MSSDPGPESGRGFPRVIADLLDDAHLVAPDRLAELIMAAASRLGAVGGRIWLADHQQRFLVPLDGTADLEPMAVDRTLAGRAWASSESVEVSLAEGGARCWLPLMDGVNRIGVLEIEVADGLPSSDPDAAVPQGLEAFRHLASVATSEIVARGQYTDAFTMARRRQEMSLAAELQWQALPPTTFATRHVTVGGLLEPAYRIGGDIFDYALNDGQLHIGIFDAIGHGLTSSLLSTLAVGAYRNRRRSGAGLVDITAAIDAAISQRGEGDVYVTGQLAILDVDGGTLQWCNAGHHLPLLIRQGSVVGPLSCEARPPFGLGHLLPDRTSAVASSQLEPEDAVLFYTDGIVEARRPGGSDFGLDRLVDYLDRAFAAGLSTAETLRRLSHAVLDFHDGELQDDASTVLVSWHPPRS